jgi:hypothetical protein
LDRAGVKFILVGGAAMIHGLGRATYDVDVVYARDEANCKKLVDVLNPFQPYLRGAPPGLPFRWNQETIKAGMNFTLTTILGNIDLLGEVTGGGCYEKLLPDCVEVEFNGARCKLCHCGNVDTSQACRGKT